MTDLLTPEQIDGIRGFADFVATYNRDPDNRRDGENHCIALLGHIDAIAERLEGTAIQHEAKAKVWRANNDIQRSRHHREFAEELRALVTAIRGNQGDSK